jgi:DNA-binding transcriptional LysR family regulator
MDMNKIRYFLAVNETGSLRKASELLNLSPAALSKSIKQLESDIGIQLLLPNGRGIIISDKGKDFAASVAPLVYDFKLILEKFKKINSSEPIQSSLLKIASFEVFTTHFLSELMNYLPSNINLDIHDLNPGEAEIALHEKKVDYLITYLPVPTSGLDFFKVTDIEMGVFGSNRDFFNLDFSQLPFAVPIQPIYGSPNKVKGLDGWPDNRLFRKIQYRVTLMESALDLCRQGHAVAYIPKFVARLHNQNVKSKFELIELTKPQKIKTNSQSVFLVKRKTDPENQFLKKLSRAIRMICKS